MSHEFILIFQLPLNGGLSRLGEPALREKLTPLGLDSALLPVIADTPEFSLKTQRTGASAKKAIAEVVRNIFTAIPGSTLQAVRHATLRGTAGTLHLPASS